MRVSVIVAALVAALLGFGSTIAPVLAAVRPSELRPGGRGSGCGFR